MMSEIAKGEQLLGDAAILWLFFIIAILEALKHCVHRIWPADGFKNTVSFHVHSWRVTLNTEIPVEVNTVIIIFILHEFSQGKSPDIIYPDAAHYVVLAMCNKNAPMCNHIFFES